MTDLAYKITVNSVLNLACICLYEFFQETEGVKLKLSNVFFHNVPLKNTSFTLLYGELGPRIED